jgi:hypothetical protein
LSLKLILTLPLAVTALAQTSKSGCAVVTLDEATAMLGPSTTQRDAGGTCIFTSQKTTVTVNVTANASAPFQIMKITANQNGAIVKDEPGIGVPAFSVVAKDGHGFSIFLLKGTWGASLGADTGASRVPDLVRGQLRSLAKKAAGRM